MARSLALVSPVVVAILLGGCSSGSSNNNQTGTADSGLQAGACTADAVPFTAGMSESSKTTGTTVAIVSDPPVPTLGDRAHFKLTVTDKSGAPVAAGTVVAMKCLMSHGGGFSHGCPATITVTDKGNGVYDAYPVIFNMQGPWDVTFTVGGTDTVSFPLCIE